MANALAVNLELMFENFVDGYDAACVLSMEAETSYPSPTDMQRAGDTFYKKQNYHTAVVNGLDVSAQTPTDVIERFVPTVFRSPDNVIWNLDAKELRDPVHMTKMGQSAAVRLAAEVDKNLYAAVRDNATIIVKKVGALTWDDGALMYRLTAQGLTDEPARWRQAGGWLWAFERDMQALLTAWGCKVITAAGLEEVQQLLPSMSMPRAIVSDYRLGGGKNGLDIIEYLRATYRREIPAILITGDTAPEMAILAQDGAATASQWTAGDFIL